MICPCKKKLHWTNKTPCESQNIKNIDQGLKNKNMGAPLTEHFLACNHSPDDLRFFSLEYIRSKKYHKIDIEKIIFQREACYIFNFQSVATVGLNANMNFSSYL